MSGTNTSTSRPILRRNLNPSQQDLLERLFSPELRGWFRVCRQRVRTRNPPPFPSGLQKVLGDLGTPWQGMTELHLFAMDTLLHKLERSQAANRLGAQFGVAPGFVEDLLQEMSADRRENQAHSVEAGSGWSEVLRPAARTLRVGVVLVEKLSSGGTGDGVVASLVLELMANGQANLYPVPAMAFVVRDQLFEQTLQGAWEAALRKYPELRHWDLRYRLVRLDNRPLPLELVGNSHGAAFRAALELLMERESIDRVGLSQTVICATCGPDDQLGEVGDWGSKLWAVLKGCAPPPHSLVVAQGQELGSLEFEEDPQNSSMLRHHGEDLLVLRAGTVSEAVGLLKVQSETRWGIDCCLPDRVGGFVGRLKLKQAIRRAIEEETEPSEPSAGYLVVMGGMGTGKTSFITELIHEEVSNDRHPVYHIIDHVTSVSARQRAIANCLYSRFRRKYRFKEPPEWAEHSVQYRLELLLQEISKKLRAEDEIEVFFVDGLDQAEASAKSRVLPGVLPAKLPPRIFGVLSSRPNTEWLSSTQKVRVFGIGGGERDTSEAEREDVREFLNQRARVLDCPLSSRLINQICHHPQPPVFFTLAARFAQWTDPKSTAEERHQLLSGPGPWVLPAEELIAQERERVLESAEDLGLKPQAVWEFLGMLAVARTPMTGRQLCEMGLWDEDVAPAVLRLAGNFFAPELPGASEEERPYRFGHPGYHRAILSELLPGRLRECHSRLARACTGWRHLQGAARSYALRFRVLHLLEAQEESAPLCVELAEALLDLEYLQARLEIPKNGGMEVFEIVGELQRVLARVEEEESVKKLEALLAVIDGNSHALSTNPEILLQQLFNGLSEDWSEQTSLGRSIRQALERSSRPMLLKRKTYGYGLRALLRTLTRHRREVTSLAISPDGEWIVTGGADNHVIVWDLKTGLPLPALRGHCRPVEALTFTPDGRLLISASLDGTVRIWDMDYESIRLGNADATLMKNVVTVPIGFPALSLAVNPSGTWFAAGCRDGAVRVWDVVSGQLLRTLQGGSKAVLSVAFSPDGRHLAAGCRDERLRIWDLTTESVLALDHGLGAEAVAFSPDGRLLASSGGLNEGFVKFWDPITGTLKRTVFGRGGRGLVALAFCADSRHLVTGGWDRTVGVWDVASWNPLPWLGHHGNVIWAVAVSANGRYLASAGSDRLVKIWDLGLIHKLGEAAAPIELPHDMMLHSAAFTRDGNRLATCSDDHTVIMRSALTGRAQSRLKGHESTVSVVRFSPDGECVATGSHASIRLHDSQGRGFGSPLQGHTDHVLALAFSNDGRFLASGSQDKSIRFWSVPDQEHLATLNGHTDKVRAIALGCGDSILVSGSDDHTVKIWDVKGRRLLRDLVGHEHRVKSVVCCPTRALVASGGGETVRLWDLHTGKCVRILLGHRHEIWSLAFSDDGRWLASGSADGTARLWDVTTGAHLGCFPCSDSVLALWFSPDARELRVADAGGAVHVPTLFHLDLKNLPDRP